MFQTHRGRLLVAMPPLTDANFDRSIVYLLEHNAEGGALGVILNRPTPERLEQISGWTARATPPGTVFAGGPVETDALIALGRRRGWTDGTTGWAALPPPSPPGIGTLDLAADPDDVAADDVRIYRGYAGWAPGQLDAEIEAGAWAVVDAFVDDLFSLQPGAVWRRVLARQSDPLRWLARVPVDVSAN